MILSYSASSSSLFMAWGTLVCLYNQLIKIQSSIKRIMRGEFHLCRKENSYTLSHRSPNNEHSINKFRFCNHDYDRNHPPNNDDIVVYKICATWSYIEIFESVFQNNIIQKWPVNSSLINFCTRPHTNRWIQVLVNLFSMMLFSYLVVYYSLVTW